MKTADLYVIVNMVTAELVNDNLYDDKDLADSIMGSYNNWLGSYCVISLKDHIDALHSHFDKTLEI